MRILYFSYYFLPHVGAATWSTYYLSSSLSRRGHKINLIVPNVQYALSINDGTAKILEKEIPVTVHRTPVLRLPRELAPFFSIFFLFFKGLRVGRGADVIVCQFHPHHFAFVVGLLIGRIFQIPVVAAAPDIYREMGRKNLGFMDRLIKVVNVFNEYFVKYAKAFLVVNSENKEILESRLGSNAASCHVDLCYNGFNLSMFKDAPNREDARKLLGIGPDDKILLFVGRFSGEEYGIEVLLKAMPNILAKVPGSVLILVGDGMTSNQQELVNSLEIGEHIRVYGPMPNKEVVKFIIVADVCVGPLMPTLATPMKILEYMACGKPVVTGVKSVSKDMNPNFNFLIIPPEPKFVVEAITKVLQNKEYARTLSSNGERFVSKFAWDNIAYDLERVLIQVCTRGEIE